jgi:hypothetical protein
MSRMTGGTSDYSLKVASTLNQISKSKVVRISRSLYRWQRSCSGFIDSDLTNWDEAGRLPDLGAWQRGIQMGLGCHYSTPPNWGFWGHLLLQESATANFRNWKWSGGSGNSLGSTQNLSRLQFLLPTSTLAPGLIVGNCMGLTNSVPLALLGKKAFILCWFSRLLLYNLHSVFKGSRNQETILSLTFAHSSMKIAMIIFLVDLKLHSLCVNTHKYFTRFSLVWHQCDVYYILELKIPSWKQTLSEISLFSWRAVDTDIGVPLSCRHVKV